jgi:hypothetical protein
MFKAFGVGYKWLDEDLTYWVTHDDIPAWISSIDWENVNVLAHNAQFDVSILCWVYGARPAFILDSLSMARALRGVEVGNSLATLAEYYGLPPKGQAVHSTNGLAEITYEIEQELAVYCEHDVELCAQIFRNLMGEVDGGFPNDELKLIDMTLKMFVFPTLELDKEILQNAIEDERTKREALLQKIGIEESSLASNDKFAVILETLGVSPPKKISKTTNKETFAFAKNDALFQALLNSDNEDVALLCEARLKVKSTLERTRAQRFADIAQRGTLPVPLNYYGAHTGRWSASKGSGLNLQNLKRNSFLRKAIKAPKGYTLVVCDLSQIEPRVLAYLADYQALLDIFNSGQDAYSAFGAQMFGIPNLSKETHPTLRQSAKSALLGCFGADTKVLTDAGWKSIISVQDTDLLWDGEEWVKHQGLLPQGEKEVLTAWGISATQDHEILTEHGWQEWKEVCTNPLRFLSAINKASLPSSDGSTTTKDFTRTSPVHVVGREELIGTTSRGRKLQDVTCVLKEKLSRLVGNRRGITPFALTETTGTDYLTESARLLSDVPIQKVKSIRTTVEEVSAYIRDGLKTGLHFLNILSPLMVGTSPSTSLTESTMIKDMNQTICGSVLGASTCQIKEKSKHETSKSLEKQSNFLKQKMQTYDIAYAGPRNRYMVLTEAGPMIVHNCGYGMGWASFSAQLLTGFLGAPPTLYDKAFAKQLGVTQQDAADFMGWDRNVELLNKIPHTCTDRELAVHSLAAKKIIEIYREKSHPVVSFWELCGSLIEHSLYKGNTYEYKCLKFEKERIILPSGLSLRYPNLTVAYDDKGRAQWSYGSDNKKLYGGKLVENIVQAVARCVMTDGMLRIQERYPCVLTVHDEVVVLVPENEAEIAETWVHAQMIKEPPYMKGIPLDADSSYAKRYGDAK